MGWYDHFSRVYDGNLERLYLDARRSSLEALRLAPGQVVLDLPCGTGQSFDGIAPALLPGGTLVGVDVSEGMLVRARQRVARHGWAHVRLGCSDVHALDADALESIAGVRSVDRLHVFLGLSAFPAWEGAFVRLWERLAPGGRCVVVDVHAAKPGLQGRLVNLVARADIRRRFWEPLERVAAGFERVELPSKRAHGGQLMLATGTKPE